MGGAIAFIFTSLALFTTSVFIFIIFFVIDFIINFVWIKLNPPSNFFNLVILVFSNTVALFFVGVQFNLLSGNESFIIAIENFPKAIILFSLLFIPMFLGLYAGLNFLLLVLVPKNAKVALLLYYPLMLGLMFPLMYIGVINGDFVFGKIASLEHMGKVVLIITLVVNTLKSVIDSRIDKKM
jgi:hypothetical protein